MKRQLATDVMSSLDNLFMSEFWQEFWTLQSSKLHFNTAYHPQTDGQSEVVNVFRNILEVLLCTQAS